MVFALSLKIFWRELKSGYLNSSLFSLILAVTIVSGISLFTDRLEKALSLESAEFLGGDLKFESNEIPREEILEKAKELGLVSSQQVLFASVVYSDSELQLSSIKTVDSFYPLIGEIELENDLGKFLVTEPPQEGEVWLDVRLKNILDIKYGEKLGIGDKDFIFSNSIIYEPDRSSSSFAFAPKAMINSFNLKETNVIQPGSRIRYSILFTGEESSLSLMNEYLESIKRTGDEITTLGDDTSSLGRAIDRSGNFFLLAGLIAVILSAFTVGISSQRFSRRHTNYVAILKTLGMNASSLKLFYFLLFLYMAILSLSVGLALGWLIQLNFVDLLSTYFPSKLPSPGLEPIFISTATVIICLIGFVYPHVLRLLKITPLSIIRKEGNTLERSSKLMIIMALISFYGLLFLYTNSILITSILFIGILFFSLLGFVLVLTIFGRKLKTGLNAHSPFSLAVSELKRRRYSNSIQVLSFMIAIGLSLIAYSSSTDLLKTWEDSVPEDSHNNFAINITKNDINPINEFFDLKKLDKVSFFPITNAKITKLGKLSSDEEMPVERNFNMTWTYTLPSQNKILEGEWFSNNSSDGISLSEEISERYELSLGDRVKVTFLDKEVETYIQSIRGVDWESFSPNFFVIGSPNLFENNSSTYITSFFIPPDQQNIASEFMRTFRTVSIFSIEEIINQVKDIIEQVSKALQVILILTTISSFFLAFSTLQDGFQIRLHQSAILRTFGARRKLITRSSLLEFSFLGLVSGLLAAGLAQLGLYFIEKEVFEVAPKLHVDIWIIGPLSGFLIISLLSIFLVSSIIKKSPKSILYGE